MFSSFDMQTRGVVSMMKDFGIPGNAEFKLHCLDMSGNDLHQAQCEVSLGEVDMCILVYSCDNLLSFENIQKWEAKLTAHAKKPLQAKILVGTKCESTNRAVSADEGGSLARRLDMEFFEVSAKDDINVSQVFQYVASQIKVGPTATQPQVTIRPPVPFTQPHVTIGPPVSFTQPHVTVGPSVPFTQPQVALVPPIPCRAQSLLIFRESEAWRGTEVFIPREVTKTLRAVQQKSSLMSR
jgi:hypothetical protein